MPSKNNIPRILNKPKTPIIKNLKNKNISLKENTLSPHDILQPNFHEKEYLQKNNKTITSNIPTEATEPDLDDYNIEDSAYIRKLNKLNMANQSKKDPFLCAEEQDRFTKQFIALAKELKIKKLPDRDKVIAFTHNLTVMNKTDFLKEFAKYFKTTMKKLYEINPKNNKEDLINDLILIIENDIADFKPILKADILNNVLIINKNEHLNKIDSLEKQIKFDRDYNITWETLKTSLYLRTSLIKLYINIKNNYEFFNN